MNAEILKLAVNVLRVNCVTAAYGKRPPSQGLQGSDAHGHQTHQVEHDSVEALQGAEETRRDCWGRSMLDSLFKMNKRDDAFINVFK